MTAINLFSLYALFSQCRSRANTLGNRFFQISSLFTSISTMCQVSLGPVLVKQNIQAKEVYWLAFHAGVFRGARVSSFLWVGTTYEPPPPPALCVGGYLLTGSSCFDTSVVTNSLCLHEVPMREGSLKWWVFLILWGVGRGVELRSLARLECEEVPP